MNAKDMDAITTAVAQSLKAAFTIRDQRIALLEQRLAAFEERLALEKRVSALEHRATVVTAPLPLDDSVVPGRLQ